MLENLLILNDKLEVDVDPKLLMILVFNKYWSKTKDKHKALKELAFLWYFCSKSKKNPYYIEWIGKDENDKIKEISRDIFDTDKFTISKELQACIDYFNSKAYSDIDDTIESLRLTKKALKDYFKNFDPETNSSTDLKNNIDNITKIDKVIKE